jgi:hypothetical protein
VRDAPVAHVLPSKLSFGLCRLGLRKPAKLRKLQVAQLDFRLRNQQASKPCRDRL